jgi:hypothetical protein
MSDARASGPDAASLVRRGGHDRLAIGSRPACVQRPAPARTSAEPRVRTRPARRRSSYPRSHSPSSMRATLSICRRGAIFWSRHRCLPDCYGAVYVVARFCPLAFSFFFPSPSFKTRGISLDCMPSFMRISSDRRPLLFFFRRATTASSALAMSSGDRLGNRPGRVARTGWGAASRIVLGRPGPRRAPSLEAPRRSSRDALRIAARMEEEKAEARSLKFFFSVDMIGK